MLIFEKAEHIKQLERSEKPRSSKLIRNLVTEHTDANESVSEILEKWRTCGEVRWRTVDGRHIRYKNFCKHPTCPRCNGWHKWKEKRRAVAIFKELTGGHWDRNDFSLLTVNDKKVSLGTYLDKRRDKMRNKLNYRFNQKLNGLVVLGEFELAHGRYELDCGFFAKLHFHCIVWHPHESRETIAKELKKAFRNDRDVQIKPIGKDESENLGFVQEEDEKDNEENEDDFEKHLEDCASYCADTDLTVKNYGEDTPDVLEALLVSTLSLLNGGRMGLRYQVGVRKIRKARKSSTQKSIFFMLSKCLDVRKTYFYNSLKLQELGCIHKELVAERKGIGLKATHRPKPRRLDKPSSRNHPRQLKPSNSARSFDRRRHRHGLVLNEHHRIDRMPTIAA